MELRAAYAPLTANDKTNYGNRQATQGSLRAEKVKGAYQFRNMWIERIMSKQTC